MKPNKHTAEIGQRSDGYRRWCRRRPV